MWIPIAAIAITVWFIRYVVNSTKTAAFDYEHDRRSKMQEAFNRRMLDKDLEQEYSMKLQVDRELRRSMAREYMQGGDEWLIYADYGSTATYTALAVMMLRHRKLPSEFTSGFLQLPRGYPDREIPTSPVRPAQCIEMNERFLLKLEEDLNSAGCGVKVMYRRDDYGWYPLRADIEESGYGRTNFYTYFQFRDSSGA